MKKITAMGLLALMIVGLVPLALADDNSSATTRGMQKGVKDQVLQADHPVLQAVKAGRQAFKDQRDAFKTVREKTKECKTQTDECKQLRQHVRAQSKVFMLGAVDAILNVLNAEKERIQSSKMSDSDKQELTSVIDAKITELNDAKASVEALGDNPDAATIKAAAEKIRAAWKDVHEALEAGRGKFMAMRYVQIENHAQTVETKIETAITNLKAKGADTSKAEADLATFKTKLATEQTTRQAAMDLRKSGDRKGANAKIEEARKQLKDALMALKQVLQDLKDLRSQMKSEKPATDATDKTSAPENPPGVTDTQTTDQTVAPENPPAATDATDKTSAPEVS